jgi:prophage antirepressor-like protein
MKNQLQVFENKDFGKVRVVQIDGQPWFVGKDVAEMLGYENGSRDIKRHVDEDDVTTAMIPQYRNGTLVSKTQIINESGLYSLIFGSKLPAAKLFKRWVTSEILPSIRKHGVYATDDTLDRINADPAYVTRLINQLKSERGKRDALENFIESLAPKARYHDTVLQCDNPIPVSIIAKDYGMTAVSFNKLLNGLGVQYSVGGVWVLYKKYGGHGYTITRTYHINERTADIRTYWTQKGRYFIYETLKYFDVLPEAEKGGLVCRT